MKTLNNNWLIFDDEMSLSKALAQEILNIAKQSILKNDCFSIVLTGGQSVLALYKILSKADSNWDKWHIYIGDERFLPKDHKDRNDRVINKIWLDNSPIPQKNIHFIQAELGLVEAKKEYEKIYASQRYMLFNTYGPWEATWRHCGWALCCWRR